MLWYQDSVGRVRRERVTLAGTGRGFLSVSALTGLRAGRRADAAWVLGAAALAAAALGLVDAFLRGAALGVFFAALLVGLLADAAEVFAAGCGRVRMEAVATTSAFGKKWAMNSCMESVSVCQPGKASRPPAAYSFTDQSGIRSNLC